MNNGCRCSRSGEHSLGRFARPGGDSIYRHEIRRDVAFIHDEEIASMFESSGFESTRLVLGRNEYQEEKEY